MNLPFATLQRLEFLARVAEKECAHLLHTDAVLFRMPLSASVVSQMAADPDQAERLDAFVARFGRLQDSVGDKFLPALLAALAEPVGPAIENLDKAERLGLIDSTESWLSMRKLRNQMVHEYIEDVEILSGALRAGHDFVPTLVVTAGRCIDRVNRLKQSATS